MQLIKGFVVINELVSNVEGTVSALGEMSPLSLTYTKERGEYYDSTVPGYSFISFTHKDTLTNNNIVVNSLQVNQILNIIKSCKTYSSSQVTAIVPEDFINFIATQYISAVNTLVFGSLINDGNISLPEWISWVDISTNNVVKIWLSDVSFSEQYDDYEIVVVPQVDNLDTLFNNYLSVKTIIDGITVPEMLEKVNIAKANKPVTSLRVYSYDLVNVLDITQKTPLLFWFLIYGKAGDNIDNIKDKLIEFILENSIKDNEEWENILPDLFKRTEFIILPRWDKIAIENFTLLSSLYSSIMNVNECIDFAKANIPFYEATFIENNTNIIPYDYKAISTIFINGPNNSEGKEDITNVFNDYIPVPSTSLDFGRMSVYTQEWSLLLGQLLIIAETATDSSITPIGFNKVKRNNILFMSVIYDNINYLVAARSNPFYNI